MDATTADADEEESDDEDEDATEEVSGEAEICETVVIAASDED